MTESEKIKIYPSASGFVTRGGHIAEYNSACARYVVVAKGSKPPDIDPIYSRLGLVHENWYAEVLGSTVERREEPITFQIEGNVWYSGRCDFITKDNTIHETKASLSKSFLYGPVRKGKYKISHLAQLVSYMIQFKTINGRIVAGYYEASKSPLGEEMFTLKESRTFVVFIDPTGAILVDNEHSGYSVVDQYKHTLLLSEVLRSGEIKDRPINHIDFSGPCRFCPLKLLCDKYDKESIDSNELKSQGLVAINEQTPKTHKWKEKKSRSKK